MNLFSKTTSKDLSVKSQKAISAFNSAISELLETASNANEQQIAVKGEISKLQEEADALEKISNDNRKMADKFKKFLELE